MNSISAQLDGKGVVASKSCCFVFPGDLSTVSGGYGYDREIIQGLYDLGWSVTLVSLSGEYPCPSEEDRRCALKACDRIADGTLVIVDGLALGAMPELAAQLAKKSRLIALVHHPLCLESGIDPVLASGLQVSEQNALRFAERVIVTSPSTQRSLVDVMAVSDEKISVVLPGIDKSQLMKGITGIKKPTLADGSLRLLCVGSLTPRKGQLHLVKVMSQLSHLNWHLDLIGETGFNPDYVGEVGQVIESFGLTDRVTIHGSIPVKELLSYYESADLFVLPTYYEGYGMAFAEAMSFGLPIVASGEGAVADTVPPSAGLHVPAGDEAALKDALELLVTDAEQRAQLSEDARIAALNLPSWQDSTKAFADILEAQR